MQRVDEAEASTLRLQQENRKLKQELRLVKKENVKLKAKLSKYETPKHSGNSSVPPSRDENRSPGRQSLRERSGKRPGGQPGHEGHTLRMSAHPDQLIEHIPQYCHHCGADLSGASGECVGRRQVVDIPPIRPVYTEHRIYRKQCPCGHATEGSFPHGVRRPVSYGSRMEGLIGYLHSRQFLPLGRMREFFHDVFSLPVSEGGLCHILNRITRKAMPVYGWIRQRIAQSGVVGADETGAKVNGKRHWFWTWQNSMLTFIAASAGRGGDTITQHFNRGFPKSILVHDCWKPHFQTPAKDHQLCIAHLLRELKYLQERYKDPWPGEFKTRLTQAIGLKKQMHPQEDDCPDTPPSRIEKAVDDLLNRDINPEHQELVTFKKRMVKYRPYLFTFLHHPKVPPDNNGSERAIRNIKVKHKVSGQFKTAGGAQQFAVLRSVTDTAIKNGQNVLHALTLIAKGYETE